jgi:hypothetical protein
LRTQAAPPSTGVAVRGSNVESDTENGASVLMTLEKMGQVS